MPIRTRKMFSESSRYIKYCAKTKTYELRVPGQVVFWPQTFRERLISSFTFDKNGISVSEFGSYKKHMEAETWRIGKQTVAFKILYLTQATGLNARRVPITCLYSSGKDEALILDSINATMRSLMVYSFVYDEQIGGLPNLKLLDKNVIADVDTKQKKR